MRAVVQRVSEASVRVDDDVVASIGNGLLVLLGIAVGDTQADALAMAAKITALRIFDDGLGAMNRDVVEAGGAVLLVSQFTLLGDARRGRRPSFIDAARGSDAEALYERVADDLRVRALPVACGRFGAHMAVALVNDGPVTILLDSRKTF